MDTTLNRRTLLKAFSIVPFARLQLTASEPGAPLFFGKDEFALLDKLTELIIPADDHSPGAHEAGVAAYIDRTVAEAFLPEEKTTWRKGLASINELSRTLHQSGFLESSGAQQNALLTQIARAEDDPKTEPEKFFTQLKQTTAATYYSSRIGIHQDINYLGNVLLKQFVGYDAT